MATGLICLLIELATDFGLESLVTGPLGLGSLGLTCPNPDEPTRVIYTSGYHEFFLTSFEQCSFEGDLFTPKSKDLFEIYKKMVFKMKERNKGVNCTHFPVYYNYLSKKFLWVDDLEENKDFEPVLLDAIEDPDKFNDKDLRTQGAICIGGCIYPDGKFKLFARHCKSGDEGYYSICVKDFNPNEII